MTTVRARTVFSDEMFTVTAIESLEFRTQGTNRRRQVIASLKPIAVIVRERDKTYALDMAAQPVDIDRLDLPADFKLD